MGFEDFRLRRRRKDVWEPEHVNWGSESTWLGDERYSGDRQLANPFGAVQMGLIHVNPQGPNGILDSLSRRARHSRDFQAHGDERRSFRVLIANVNTFGKTHGAGPATHVGPEPEGAISRSRDRAGRQGT